MNWTRRQIIAAAGAPALAQSGGDALEDAAVRRYDQSVERLLKAQITDPASPNRGAIPDAAELYYAGSASGIVDQTNAVFHHPKSKFHRAPLMLERMKLAMDFFERSLSPEGNIDNPITNFNSPADTAFAAQNLAMAANIARKSESRQALAIIEPGLRKAARGLVTGGVHTPNHRWVMCAALAQINEIWPDKRWVKRINQWLAEGIDIDEDGQFDERSMLVYNPITDRALVLMAAKLNRPELLDPVRRNLESALYLVHADDEMVTEISHRQDRNQRGDIGAYWFPMHYLALRDGNGQFAHVAARYAERQAGLSLLMDMPELLKPLPEPKPLPDRYEKHFPAMDAIRLRRGEVSATILLRGDSRFFMIRRGKAVINAVRFASAFFGKGQFLPRSWSKTAAGWTLRQSLSGPYFQPLDPPHAVAAGEWTAMRPERERSQICFLEQSATISETAKGFALRLQSHGTKGVPVAVEISLRGREGLTVDGLLPARDVTDGFLLPAGAAVVRVGGDELRFGPGRRENLYTQVRGADPKLPGASVYLTGFTPFDHTLEIDCYS